MNMNNPYLQMANLGGQDTPFQNVSAQQSLYQQNMSNMGNLANQALASNPTAPMQFDNKAMAKALRDGQQAPQGNDWMTRADMAMNSQAGADLAGQVNQLGSSTWNPFSDYNMGANGWGNYGE